MNSLIYAIIVAENNVLKYSNAVLYFRCALCPTQNRLRGRSQLDRRDRDGRLLEDGERFLLG